MKMNDSLNYIILNRISHKILTNHEDRVTTRKSWKICQTLGFRIFVFMSKINVVVLAQDKTIFVKGIFVFNKLIIDVKYYKCQNL